MGAPDTTPTGDEPNKLNYIQQTKNALCSGKNYCAKHAKAGYNYGYATVKWFPGAAYNKAKQTPGAVYGGVKAVVQEMDPAVGKWWGVLARVAVFVPTAVFVKNQYFRPPNGCVVKLNIDKIGKAVGIIGLAYAGLHVARSIYTQGLGAKKQINKTLEGWYLNQFDAAINKASSEGLNEAVSAAKENAEKKLKDGDNLDYNFETETRAGLIDTLATDLYKMVRSPKHEWCVEFRPGNTLAIKKGNDVKEAVIDAEVYSKVVGLYAKYHADQLAKGKFYETTVKNVSMRLTAAQFGITPDNNSNKLVFSVGNNTAYSVEATEEYAMFVKSEIKKYNDQQKNQAGLIGSITRHVCEFLWINGEKKSLTQSVMVSIN